MLLIVSLACFEPQNLSTVDLDRVSPYTPGQTDMLNETDDMTLLTGEVCDNPCRFEVEVPENTVYVEYFADNIYFGQGRSNSDFSHTYTFEQTGDRKIEAVAFDGRDQYLGYDIKYVHIMEDDFVELASEPECSNPCTFSVNASENIDRVQYLVDGWEIGSTSNAAYDFRITYDFNQSGLRTLEVLAYAGDTVVATDTVSIDIQSHGSGVNGNVPYFYQYSNALYPSSSCQNTSIAMVLAYFGWNGVPDDITAYWGKNYAQSPHGLADVFNSEASWGGINARVTPVTNGTLAGLRAELDAGNPTIVHGYFTSYGHVMVVLGYDENGYYVNDPAGRWSQYFKGGYPYSWNSTIGQGIYYSKSAFEMAIATWDGYTPAPLWYHQIR